MNEKCAIVSCKGLGDALIIMILSHNLYLNGYKTTTFHSGSFSQLQEFFPHLPIEKFPKMGALEFLSSFDKVFVAHDSEDPFICEIIKIGKEKFPEKIKVLNPSISKNEGTQPFYEDACFHRDISMVDNMANFCKKIGLKNVVRENGIQATFAKEKSEVIIHPTSAKSGKMWPREKYIKLSQKLEKAGFKCIFVMSPSEAPFWQEHKSMINIKSFDSLAGLAKCLAKSAFMIGNDSGVGHLASALKVPTLSIFRSKRSSILWKPSWQKGLAVYPSEIIPNISGLRLRDKYWKHFVSIRKVWKSFLKLRSFSS